MEIETVNKHCKHKDCKYRQHLNGSTDCCVYAIYNYKLRGCLISECDKYERGRIRVNPNETFEWLEE